MLHGWHISFYKYRWYYVWILIFYSYIINTYNFNVCISWYYVLTFSLYLVFLIMYIIHQKKKFLEHYALRQLCTNIRLYSYIKIYKSYIWVSEKKLMFYFDVFYLFGYLQLTKLPICLHGLIVVYMHACICSFNNKILTSCVIWWDCSQFGDICQKDTYCINIMKNELEIVKELLPHLESLDMEAISSLVCHLCYFLVYFLLWIIFTHFTRIVLTCYLALPNYRCWYSKANKTQRIYPQSTSYLIKEWCCPLLLPLSWKSTPLLSIAF